MTNSALITMLVTQILVTLITGYFFYRVLTSKQNPETDSFSENDKESH